MDTRVKTSLRTSIAVIFLALSIGSLACLPCQTSSQLAPTPERTVPVSAEDAQELVSTLGQGIVPDSEGNFALTITEEELTSYVALNMQESIIDPQVLLTAGQIELYGTMVSPIEAPVAALATIHIDETGPHVAVESVSVGGFPLPQTFVEAFAQQIEDFYAAAQRHEDVEITHIEIGEGKLIIRGTVAP
jgi:uncharacterized protein YpmS